MTKEKRLQRCCDEAEEAGYAHLKQVNGSGSMYRCKSCNDERIYQRSNVKNERFKCSVCERNM
jgi:hypothetical protein